MSHELTSIFSDRVREDDSYGRHSESTYAYIDRSSRLEVAEVRGLLDRWFRLYPENHRSELRARFVADFHGAFWELFLHAYFCCHGFQLTPHPEMPNVSTRPDYLVSGSDVEFYLEAIVARDKSDEQIARESMRNLLYDAINATKSPNFFLALRDFTIKEGRQPAARKISAFLEREVAKYEPDQVAQDLAQNVALEGPALVFEDETIRLEVTLVPRSPKARGSTDIRPIGIYPFQTRWGGADAALKDAVAGKATRYGQLERPYIVGVNCTSDWGVDEDDILDALFGTHQVSFSPEHAEPVSTRKRDGALMGPTGPRNTRVSAVIMANLYPWGLHAGRFELYHNPWASRPIAGGLPPIRQAHLTDRNLQWTAGLPLLELFGLPEGWPQVPAA